MTMTHIRLCTTMLNEALTLPRLAEGCKGIIDSYLIIDDVMTDDDSAAVAWKVFDYVPGEVIQPKREFDDIVQKRNFALGSARAMGEDSDYLLVMMSDDKPELLAPLPELDQPIYGLVVRSGLIEVIGAHLVRADYPCEWRDPVHEYLFHEHEELHVLQHILIHRYGTNATREDHFERMTMLQERFQRSGNPRDLYYIAQTFIALEQIERAFFCFMRFANTAAREEERYVGLLDAALLLEFTDIELCLHLLKRAQLFRGSRPESYYHLARVYNNLGEHRVALTWANKGINLPRTNDGFFVMRALEETGMQEELERAQQGALSKVG